MTKKKPLRAPKPREFQSTSIDDVEPGSEARDVKLSASRYMGQRRSPRIADSPIVVFGKEGEFGVYLPHDVASALAGLLQDYARTSRQPNDPRERLKEDFLQVLNGPALLEFGGAASEDRMQPIIMAQITAAKTGREIASAIKHRGGAMIDDAIFNELRSPPKCVQVSSRKEFVPRRIKR